MAAILALVPGRGLGAAAQPFSIPVVLPLSGGSAFIGQGSQTSLLALERSVNEHGGIGGRPLQFVFHDDTTKPEVDVQLAHEIIAEGAQVIVGTATVAGCRAMQPLISQGPVMYCMSPGLYPPPGSFAFSSNVSTIDLATAALRYFVMKGVRRIAMITAIDANGQDAEKAFDAGLRALDADHFVVAREHFNVTDLSVAAEMEHIGAASPQLIIAWSTGTPMGTLLRGIKEAGLDGIPILSTNANANRATLHQFGALLPKQLFFPLRVSEVPLAQIDDPKTRAAIRSYDAAMKAVGVAQPDETNDGCWDLGLILVDAFRKLGTGATADQIRRYIAALKGWTGIQGQYDFLAHPQRGLAQSAVVVTRWDPVQDGWVAVSKLSGVPSN